MKTAIDSIIDGKDAYGYAFMTSEYGYGHMTVNIRGEAPAYGYRKNGVIKVTCQIGSSDYAEQNAKPYAIKHGFDSQDSCIDAAELEVAVKLLRKIQKYLDKVEAINGYADDYAEFCHRVIVGSGVKHLITESGDGWASGGRIDEKQLYAVGGKSRARLVAMEAALIGRFSRKAA